MRFGDRKIENDFAHTILELLENIDTHINSIIDYHSDLTNDHEKFLFISFIYLSPNKQRIKKSHILFRINFLFNNFQ